MKSLKKKLIDLTDVSNDEQPQCEKVDELSATEKAEAHAEADNTTKDANELLQNYNRDQVTLSTPRIHTWVQK